MDAWYALWTRSRHEQLVCRELTTRRFEAFLPTISRWSVWKDRKKQIQWPLFPGYCFARFPADSRYLVLNCAGVVNIVSFGGEPASIPDDEIENVRRLVTSELQYDPCPLIREGTRVEVVRGPLAGVTGRLIRKGTNAHLVLSVEAVGQSVSVHVDASDVAPSNPAPSRPPWGASYAIRALGDRHSATRRCRSDPGRVSYMALGKRRELLSWIVALMLLMVGGSLPPCVDAQDTDQRPANPHRSPDQSSKAGAPLVAADKDEPAAMTLWASGRYRLTPSNVLELHFPYVPEFDQTVTVQPDGYISLRGVGKLRVYGRTLPELRLALRKVYDTILKEPVINIVFKEFEKPFFFAAGEVVRPGKYELRGATMLTQALASAGGLTSAAKHSQVILFRRYSADWLEGSSWM